MAARPTRWFSRENLRRDAVAGLVLGIESVPDGLANGLLAGVNPLAGLYGYMFGLVGAAFFTGSALMAVQGTGSMALIVSDAGLESMKDPDAALYTLAMLTGIVMIIAGLLRAGRLVRFVPTAVMTGFTTAVGVNIVLGQLSNFTGYDSRGANRVLKTFDLLAHLPSWSAPALAVGAITVLTIMVLQPTRVGSFGLVLAVVLGSVVAALLDLWVRQGVVVLDDKVDVPSSLPIPVLPSLTDVPVLLLPAISLAFVAMVQGAGVAASIPSLSGRPDVSRDLVGQGIGSIVSGAFQGVPVGGSTSASSLLVGGGARTRMAKLYAGIVIALIVLFASQIVAYIAMPALAGLLIVVGIGAIKPSRVYSVVKSGPLPSAVMGVTFVLTLLIPLQFAVLMGVGLGIVLFVAQQSNRVRVRRVVIEDDGRLRETDPPAAVGPGEICILQPYGSLFFASAPVVEKQLPTVSRHSKRCVVILRLRGTDQIGLSFVEVLRRLAADLRGADSTLKLVISEPAVMRQVEASGLVDELGAHNVYRGTEWVGQSLQRAYVDAKTELSRS
ncbi:sulfate transporter [Microbacterium mangrovi]|uniref:Sulfate transporter n=1 Tax=Microbacterium mangrovi TaxID=1348253 RepID=A0A0B2A7E5_9MICO|nr:SulP family inorganic anion transporter [Microbacterium mangrovi]KHK97658.1 sulfate transporter [Microbacterium mangrovi]